MNSSRRSFLQKAGMLVGAFSVNSLFNEAHALDFELINQQKEGIPANELAGDEDYWSVIQQAYSVNPSIINLNNGGVSPAPRIVQDALDRYNKLVNEGPSYYMWRVLDLGREPLREKLADLAGASAEEIAINRNCSEGLNTIVYGLPLKKGDEVIGCQQDYVHVINSWKQRAARDGIIYKQISFKFPIEDDDAIVKAYENAITPRTKLLHITHVINWMGQILPVKKITEMAARKGVETLVDGAHSFGLLDFNIPDLGCDYFATSLHKFLSAPVGSGMLWVRKSKIAALWPLASANKPESDDIRKFEELGTRSIPIEQAIGEAINFHNAIGTKRKQERLHYLTCYWANAVKKIPGVNITTSLNPAYGCAICGVTVDSVSIDSLNHSLITTYRIHTTVVTNIENIRCVRITPHVYTKLKDLDKLIAAITAIATQKNGK